MKYDLVFEGGGAKGFAFLGAMKVFERECLVEGSKLNRIIGTSTGSLMAILLTAGYNADELREITEEKVGDQLKISTFKDIPENCDPEELEGSLLKNLLSNIDLPFLPPNLGERVEESVQNLLLKSEYYRLLYSFLEKGGIYEGRVFIDWLSEALSVKNPDYKDMTLEQFYFHTGIHLSIIASDTTDGAMLVLNHITSPDCPVVMAARMSISIPFLWQEVEWQKEWGQYHGNNISGHHIVDGGILSNFPIQLLISKDDTVKAIMGEKEGGEVIGFLIDESKELENAPVVQDDKKIVNRISELKLVQRISNLVNTITSGYDRLYVETHREKVCFLPAKGYRVTEFDMSDARRLALITAGAKAMEDYLRQRE